MKHYIERAFENKKSVRLTFSDGSTKVYSKLGPTPVSDMFVEFLVGNTDKEVLVNLTYVSQIEVSDSVTQSVNY